MRAGDAAGDEVEDDAAWEQIVASLRGPDTDGNTSWPSARSDEPGSAPNDEPGSEPRDENGGNGSEQRRTPPPPEEPIIIWRGSEADVDRELERAVPDEHFVPPEPPPLPRADAITWLAWIGVIGGPLLLLVIGAIGASTGLLVTVSTAAFLGGLAVLITRMRTHRDPFDPDDGAVV